MGYSTFTDYEDVTSFSSTSNPQGFSSVTQNICYYSRIGKMVHCIVRIVGTSNATSLTFTLPYASSSEGAGIQQVISGQLTDNGSTAAGPCKVSVGDNSTTATCYKDGNNTLWTAANTKAIVIEFFYRRP